MTDVPPEPSPPTTLTGIAARLAGGLQGQPVIITLLLVNLAFLAVISLAVREERQQDHAEMQQILDRCLPGKG